MSEKMLFAFNFFNAILLMFYNEQGIRDSVFGTCKHCHIIHLHKKELPAQKHKKNDYNQVFD